MKGKERVQGEFHVGWDDRSKKPLERAVEVPETGKV